jgi:D-alanine-D-alanine ligase
MSDHTQNIAIVYGGESSEHDVSIKTFLYLFSRLLEKPLRSDLKISAVVYITRDGQAVVSQYDATKDPVTYHDTARTSSLIDAIKQVKEQNLFLCSLMYGQNGEDGRFQGLCEFLSIPSNLGSVLPASLTMSKYHLNQYLQGNTTAVKIPLTVTLRSSDDLENQLSKFAGREIVVKPNSLGSSVMTEKITYDDASKAHAHELIAQILQYDEIAMVQEYVSGQEYTVACVEKDGEVIVLPAIRIETEGNFFGSKEKYITGFSNEVVVPEAEDPELLKKAKQASKEIFIDLDCRNAVRFDFIITDSEAYFLEANPFPGFTKGSLLPKMTRTRGWDIEDMIGIYVDNAKQHTKAKTEFVVELS